MKIRVYERTARPGKPEIVLSMTDREYKETLARFPGPFLVETHPDCTVRVIADPRGTHPTKRAGWWNLYGSADATSVLTATTEVYDLDTNGNGMSFKYRPVVVSPARAARGYIRRGSGRREDWRDELATAVSTVNRLAAQHPELVVEWADRRLRVLLELG